MVSDKTDLRRRILALHNAVTAASDSIFFPTGGVFLTVTAERMRQIKEGKAADPATGEVNAEDLWSVYAEWHETVHMFQLVTCPYVRLRAFQLATLAKHAYRQKSQGEGDSPPVSELVDQYRSAMPIFDNDPPPGHFSAWEIVETHAVAQGVLWLTGSSESGLRQLADDLYNRVRKSPRYLRLIDAMGDRVGDQVAVQLLPRLCFLALQTLEPSEVFAGLCGRLADEGSAARLAISSTREFCEWVGVDAAFVSRSLRERDVEVEGHPWMRIFSRYFDRFEALPDVDARLRLLLGPRGDEAYRMFRPPFTVYSDGSLALSDHSSSPLAAEEEELWITIATETIEGLERLWNAAGRD
jgi:hypothetical protein